MTSTIHQLTPAGFAYLGGLYEAAVDRGLNLVEVQAYLGSKGVHRAMLQIKHELTHVFQFPGYVEAHPAPPMQSAAEFDRQLGG
jgi:hypothetical protein